MDGSHVALASIELRSEAYSKYRCDRPMSVGINIESLTKIVKQAGNEDVVTLSKSDDADNLEIKFESSIKKDGIVFESAGEIGKGKKKSSKKDDGEDDGPVPVNIEMQQATSMSFALKYLNHFAKAGPLSKAVTLSMTDDLPLMVSIEILDLQMLQRGEPHYGALVRSIRFEQQTDYSDKADLNLLAALGDSFSTLPPTAGSSERAWQGMGVAIGRCYRQVVNLQSLVILNSSLSFFHHFFHHKIGEEIKPHYFLTSSLKRLFMPLWDGTYVNSNLNARNATWLLVFCGRIEEACLAFEMSVEDSKYLSEFAEAFAGLSSVKKLAIKVDFVYLEAKKKTWWGGPEEQNGTYKGGNRKTESIISLLQSTNQLDALELYIFSSEIREGDHSQVSLNCLSTLQDLFVPLSIFDYSVKCLGKSSSLYALFKF
ncbi:hypothetical protein L7F22_042713 [Adiantum nelumboides]|nr:hypothetical protein [Adiantum nelumboides]